MTALSGSGVLACPTTGVGTTVDVTWPHSEKPKAIKLYCMAGPQVSGTDAVALGNKSTCVGFGTSSTNRYCVSSAATHPAGTSDGSKRMANDAIFQIITVAGGGVVGSLDLDAVANWPSNGFRLIVDTQFATAYRIGWVAYGGSDITDAICVLFQEPAATGNQDITSPGFTCTDDNGIAFFISMCDATVPSAGFINSRAGKTMYGAASSSTKYAVICCNDDQGSTSMDNTSYCSDDLAIALIPDTGGAAVDGRATFSWITNGFQLAWAERTSTRYIAALVIKGGKWSVNGFLTKTDTTTDIVIAPGFVCDSVVVVSGQKAEDAADTAAVHDQISMGAFTSTSNRHAQAYLAVSGGTLEDITNAVEYDSVYINLTSGAVEGKADVQSVSSSDGFALRMSDADPTAMFGFAVSFGHIGVTIGTKTLVGGTSLSFVGAGVAKLSGARLSSGAVFSRTSGARVKITTLLAFLAGARLRSTLTKTLPSDTRLSATLSLGKTSGTRLRFEGTKTLSSGAMPAETRSLTLPSGARTRLIASFARDSGARLRESSVTFSRVSGARLKTFDAGTVDKISGARLRTPPITKVLASGAILSGISTLSQTVSTRLRLTVAGASKASGARLRSPLFTQPIPSSARLSALPGSKTLVSGAGLQTAGVGITTRVSGARLRFLSGGNLPSHTRLRYAGMSSLPGGARVSKPGDSVMLSSGSLLLYQGVLSRECGARLRRHFGLGVESAARVSLTLEKTLSSGAAISGADSPIFNAFEEDSRITTVHSASSRIQSVGTFKSKITTVHTFASKVRVEGVSEVEE